jgi:phosphopantothenoylcysteine decarboxylase/phosphopantothenate--cysteine ligase
MEPIPLFKSKHIVLSVCGGIAAYKAADLASKLTQAGALVDTVLTEAAQHFVGPVTFAGVTGRKVFTDADLWDHSAHVPHVALGHQADLVIVAPATANTLAKLAHGIADNMVSIVALAARGPVLVAPAMDVGMWDHSATQAAIEMLRQRGVLFVGPEKGRMASGLVGYGRMSEPLDILGHARLALAKGGPLAHKRVIVTAGGTQEPLDPVRYVGNRSSGKQGFALAQAALDCGACVTLIVGATADLPTPVGAQRVNVRTAEQMRDAVLAACAQADLLLMAAAVADFKPIQSAEQKIKKTAETVTLSLELSRTPDILAAVKEIRAQGQGPQVVVGFAAETQNLLDNAAAKLQAKGLDIIAANDVSASDAGFAVDTNRITLLMADPAAPGGVAREDLPLMSKAAVAETIITRAAARLSLPAISLQRGLPPTVFS